MRATVGQNLAKTWQCPMRLRPKKVYVTASFTQKGEKTVEADWRYLAGLYRLMIHLIAVKCRYKNVWMLPTRKKQLPPLKWLFFLAVSRYHETIAFRSTLSGWELMFSFLAFTNSLTFSCGIVYESVAKFSFLICSCMLNSIVVLWVR